MGVTFKIELRIVSNSTGRAVLREYQPYSLPTQTRSRNSRQTHAQPFQELQRRQPAISSFQSPTAGKRYNTCGIHWLDLGKSRGHVVAQARRLPVPIFAWLDSHRSAFTRWSDFKLKDSDRSVHQHFARSAVTFGITNARS